MLPPDMDRFPSHLHINLLPGARGQGVGRRLMNTVFSALARSGSPGVQLGVRASNTGALAFYRALHMPQLPSADQNAVRFGRPLRP